MKKIYTSIDIGSDTIKIVVGESFNGNVNVLAAKTIKSKGVRKGLITDPNLAITAIKDGMLSINDMLGITIKKVIATVPSYNAKFMYVTGSVNITSPDGFVTNDDVNRVIKDSIYSKIAQEYELVTVIPTSFLVDNEEVSSKPVGMQGKKLDIKGIMITTPKKNIYSVINVLEGAGLEVVDIAVSGLGDYFEVHNANIDKKVGAIINIGHEPTTVSVINHGQLMNTDVIQLGGYNVEKDIAYIFGINVFDARILKERFASSHKRFSQLNDTYEITNNANEKIKLNQLEVTEVVMSRMAQILKMAKKQILLLTKHDIGYIIITGGLTEIKSFKNLVFEILGKDVIIFTEETLGVRDNMYTTSLGLIKYFCDKMESRGRSYSMVDEMDVESLTTPFMDKNKKDNTTITKIFGNFTKSIKEEK